MVESTSESIRVGDYLNWFDIGVKEGNLDPRQHEDEETVTRSRLRTTERGSNFSGVGGDLSALPHSPRPSLLRGALPRLWPSWGATALLLAWSSLLLMGATVVVVAERSRPSSQPSPGPSSALTVRRQENPISPRLLPRTLVTPLCVHWKQPTVVL